MNGFLPLLRGDLLLQADVERVSPLLRVATLKDGRRFHYDTLISTLPLPVLIASMGDEAPAEVRRAASELRHVSIRCVNLGIARPHVTDKHWIYFPEDTVFHRVFVQGNASPHCNPARRFRTYLRDQLLAVEAIACHRRGIDRALHPRLRAAWACSRRRIRC